MKKRIPMWVLVAGLGVAGVGGANASSSNENDARDIAQARLSLGQAVEVAQRQAGGVASHAGFGRFGGRAVFLVELVRGRDVVDVQVDALSGKVIAVDPDRPDNAEQRPDRDREAG
jgi:uncharacterized membrane protein YkoI